MSDGDYGMVEEMDAVERKQFLDEQSIPDEEQLSNERDPDYDGESTVEDFDTAEALRRI